MDEKSVSPFFCCCENGVRYLKELRLWEGSLVTFPMNEAAQVTSVKTLADIQPLLHSITDASDAEVTRQLRSINGELKRLLRKESLCECDSPECMAGDCVDCSKPDCVDENCEGCVGVEELAALKQLAMSLKSLVQ